MSIRNSEELAVIALGYKDNHFQPAIRLWNETHYLLASNEQESDANNSAPMEEPQ
jgi:hypothetical protein